MTDHDIRGLELAASILSIINLPALSAEIEWALTAPPDLESEGQEARVRVQNVRQMVETAKTFVEATRTWGLHARRTLSS